MEKLYVFTLNFAADTQSLSDKPGNVPKTLLKDEFGIYQCFESPVCLANLESGLINYYMRSFTKISQVKRCAEIGCRDIERFFYLVSSIASREKIEIMFRIVIHGSLKKPNHFSMDDYSNVKSHEETAEKTSELVKVSAKEVVDILYHSLPLYAQNIFTPDNPLKIQLISCTAGGSVNYENLSKNSLTSDLMNALLSKNIFSQIRASTTNILRVNEYMHLRYLSYFPLRFNRCSVQNIYESVFGELYFRRGLLEALEHFINHYMSCYRVYSIKAISEILFNPAIEEPKNLRLLPFYHFMQHIYRMSSFSISDILSQQRQGSILLYKVNENRKITIYDYASPRREISKLEENLESCRNQMLTYFWVGYFFEYFYQQHPHIWEKQRYLFSLTSPLKIIEEIELAKGQREILDIIKKCADYLNQKHVEIVSNQNGLMRFFHKTISHNYLHKCKMQTIDMEIFKDILMRA